MITVIGGRGVTLAQLEKIEPTTPENAGKRWKPVRHADLVNTIKAEVAERGWAVSESRYTTARKGADMAGALMFKKVAGLANINGMEFAMGFINSNDRRKALKITVGANIFICKNGLCTGTILLTKVHDHTVALAEQIKVAMDGYVDSAARISDMVERLQERALHPREAAGLCLLAADHGLIGYTAAGRVYREYKNPRFKEHGKNTSWALLNAFTYAARPNIAPTRQMEAYNSFREMLPVAGDN